MRFLQTRTGIQGRASRLPAQTFISRTPHDAYGCIELKRLDGPAQAIHNDAPAAGSLATRDLPDVASVGVALEAQPHQLSVLVRAKSQEDYIHDHDVVPTCDTALMLVGDHSPSSHRISLNQRTNGAARGATVAEVPGGDCKENGTCESRDEDIVPWIPKRRRGLAGAGGSAEVCDSSQPSLKRQRRQMHIVEPAGRASPCRRAGRPLSSRPASRYAASARLRLPSTITPTSPALQREGEPTPPRGLESDNQPTWEVDRVVGSVRKHSKVFYKVRWKPTWEPAASLQGSANAAIEEFRSSHKHSRTK